MRVESLRADNVILENGERVYSPNNKPTAEDIGALPTDGKAVNSERVGDTTLSTFFNRKSFRVGGNGNTYYPVVVDTKGVVPRKFRIYRANIHANKDWWGSLNLTVQANSSAYGHIGPLIHKLDHLWSGHPTQGSTRPLAKFIATQNQAGYILIWLNGDTSYEFESFEGCELLSANIEGNAWNGNLPISVTEAMKNNKPTVNAAAVFDATGGNNSYRGTYIYMQPAIHASQLFEEGGRVYSEGNKPALNDLSGKAGDTALFNGRSDQQYVYGTNSKATMRNTDAKINTRSGFLELAPNTTNKPGAPHNWFWGIQTAHSLNQGSVYYGSQFGVGQDNKAYYRVQDSAGNGAWSTVYSDTNKPTAADVGALPAGGKALRAGTSDLLGNTNLNKNVSSFISIVDNGWWGDTGIGHSQMVKNNSVGKPSGDGYVFKIGARDISSGSGWLYMDNFSVGGNLWYGATPSSKTAPTWNKLYSTNNKPTPDDIGAVAKTGATMTGDLSIQKGDNVSSTIRLNESNGRHGAYWKYNADLNRAVFGTRNSNIDKEAFYVNRNSTALHCIGDIYSKESLVITKAALKTAILSSKPDGSDLRAKLLALVS